ncbi:hypothetical protein PR048_018003 [Dryococelus australis]|uniref:CCR4-NOT transcription complex subunit 10 n=1 Tax=Dryococelus australis TaxID=614101 RepID=A0ABQ9HB23_9NEOP|nr:hypothetical protein PR048_018003 [Dryococelus australis]
MAGNKEISLSSLYAELSRFGQKEEYERALKTANKSMLFITNCPTNVLVCVSVLQQKNDEQKAFHCKIICLVQLSRFQDALKACVKEPKLSA